MSGVEILADAEIAGSDGVGVGVGVEVGVGTVGDRVGWK